MNTTFRNIILVVIGLMVGFWAVKIVLGVVGSILGMIVPALVVVGILYGAYVIFGRKALGGGRRTLP